MKRNSLLTLIITLFCWTHLFSQVELKKSIEHKGCGTEHLHNNLLENNEEYKHRYEQSEQLYRRIIQKINSGEHAPFNGRTLETIPVVVHVMHLPGTAIGQDENIPMTQIEAGIEHLNQAFANTGAFNESIDNSNAASMTSSVNTEIQFCLAKQDPSGNPTNGVNRVATTYSNLFRDEPVSSATSCANGSSRTQDGAVKDLSRWDPTKYLNIWLVKEICTGLNGSYNCGVAGYAYYSSAHGMCVDGIVNEASFFGSSVHNSKVHVHEAGHYLNLKHTFQGGCTNNNCLVDGDAVCDTPPDGSTSSINCNNGDTANTCSTDTDDNSANNPFTSDVEDLYENYMDYGWQSCQHVFTQGQKNRMKIAIQNDRPSLVSSSNIACQETASNVVYFYDEGTLATETDASTTLGCRKYYDVNIPIRLYKTSASNTTIQLTINTTGTAGTAATPADIELITPSVTINAGAAESNATVRIYDDKAIENTETAILEISNVTGGASVATFNQEHKISILDNDIAPNGNRPVIFEDDFENGLGNWIQSAFGSFTTNRWETGNVNCLTGKSAYVSNDNGTTNNYSPITSNPIIYKTINATGYTDLKMEFDYSCGGDGNGDKGRYIHRTGTDYFSVGSSYSNTSCSNSQTAVVDFSGYDNSEFSAGFYFSSDGSAAENPAFTVDNVKITGAATDITKGNNLNSTSSSAYLGPDADVYFLNNDGKLIARIKNLSSHDYGCTTINVTSTSTPSIPGATSTPFDGYTFVNKDFTVTPTNNNTSGTYEITLYYSETELSNWTNASTSNEILDLKIAKSTVDFDTGNPSETNSSISTPALPIPAFTQGVSRAYTASFSTGFSNFRLTNTPESALPVELVSFDGKRKGNQVVLHWETTSELNNDYFIIERSSNGSTNFKEIGRVKGNGTSTESHNYKLIDKNPIWGSNYYRLVQVDIDQKQTNHGLVHVEFNKHGVLNIFPVPTKSNDLNITYDAPFSGLLKWKIYDTNGTILKNGTISLQKGINRLLLEDLLLSNGVYFMQFQLDDLSQETKRVVILN